MLPLVNTLAYLPGIKVLPILTTIESATFLLGNIKERTQSPSPLLLSSIEFFAEDS